MTKFKRFLMLMLALPILPIIGIPGGVDTDKDIKEGDNTDTDVKDNDASQDIDDADNDTSDNSTDDSNTSADNNLPKSQEELDALIEKRLKRERKKLANQQTNEPPQSGADQEPQNTQTTTINTELLEARAQLAAYKSGVKDDAVEDLVYLARREVEKSGDELDDDNIQEAIKTVLKRHPEWKSTSDGKSKSIRIGADNNNPQKSEPDRPATPKKRWNRFN